MAEQTQLDVILRLKDEMSGGLKSANSTLSNLGSGFANLGQKVAVGIGASVAGITALGVAGVKSAADFEQTKIAMTTMTGSAEEAGNILKNISKFAAETPFEFPELATTTKQLMAFGMTGNEAVDGMKMLGDISAGLNVPIGDLGYLLGTLKTQGRAMTIDIRQFAMRGLPIYEALSSTMGVSVEKVNELVTAGKVGYPEVQKALQSMTDEGGKFHGMMAQQAKSLSGLWSTLKDNTSMALREIVGISQEGVVREGSIFDILRTTASNFIVWIDANKENIINFFTNVVNAIQNFAQLAWTYIEPVYNLLKEFFSDVENRKAVMVAVLAVLTGAFVAWGISVVIAMAPVTLAILAIGTIVFLLAKAWNENWGGMQDKLKAVFQAMVNFYEQYVIPLFQELKKRSDEALKFWKENWENVKTFFAGIWQAIVGVFQVAWALFSGVFKIAIDIFTGNWKKAWEDAKTMFENIFKGIYNFGAGIFKSIVSAITVMINAVINQLNKLIEKMNKVPGVDIGKIGNVSSAVSDLPTLAVGTNYVPRDTMAILHEGEAVVPKKYNPNAGGMTGGGKNITIQISGDNYFSNDLDIENLIDKIKISLSREQEKADWGIA